MTRQPTNQVAYTDLYVLEDINGDEVEDVNNDALYFIWPSIPFNPQRH